MEIEYDPVKNARNVLERGISFDSAHSFDLDSADIVIAERHGEIRFLATGYIGERLHIMVFKLVQARLRVISLRKANQREVKRYGKTRER